jgi:hypothetical protein
MTRRKPSPNPKAQSSRQKRERTVDCDLIVV